MKLSDWSINSSAAALFAAISAFSLAIFLSGCSGSGHLTPSTSSNEAHINLNFPDGFVYDDSTHAVYSPSGQNNAALPAYVTGMTLCISGEDMETQCLPIDMETMSVSFAITPGVRTFTITVTTSIGLTFTDTVTLDVVSGSALSLGFNLNINAPPSIGGIFASPTSAKPGDVISLSCTGEDLDPGDSLSITWSGPGGWAATGSEASFTIPSFGVYEFTCNVNDGWGGVVSSSVIVTAINLAPVITSASVTQGGKPVNWMCPPETVDLSCSAVDNENDPLTYRWSGPDGVVWGANVSYTVNSMPATANFSCIVNDPYNEAVTYTISIDVGC